MSAIDLLVVLRAPWPRLAAVVLALSVLSVTPVSAAAQRLEAATAAFEDEAIPAVIELRAAASTAVGRGRTDR